MPALRHGRPPHRPAGLAPPRSSVSFPLHLGTRGSCASDMRLYCPLPSSRQPNGALSFLLLVAARALSLPLLRVAASLSLQLLDDFDADAEITIADLARSAAGNQVLGEVAHPVRPHNAQRKPRSHVFPSCLSNRAVPNKLQPHQSSLSSQILIIKPTLISVPASLVLLGFLPQFPSLSLYSAHTNPSFLPFLSHPSPPFSQPQYLAIKV